MVIQNWYQSAAVCVAGTCSIAPPTILANGELHRWWILTYFDDPSPGLYGPWSAFLEFTPSDPLPAATLVSPTGAVGTLTPTYTWNKVPASTWYYLWVEDASDNIIIQTWYRSVDVCGATTCSVTPATPLADGVTHAWWIQTFFPSGYGPWSDPLVFVPLPVVPDAGVR